MARSLDKRFADDLKYLLDRDGAQRVAEILIKVSENIGFRGWFEEEVSRHVRRHPGRRVELVVVSERADD
jgi:hypothetical protein